MLVVLIACCFVCSYGVVVDGDRRRKVHWLSQEEIIDKGVLDVKPSQDSGLPEGCRVCARWSAHQKCYYPGRIIDGMIPSVCLFRSVSSKLT